MIIRTLLTALMILAWLMTPSIPPPQTGEMPESVAQFWRQVAAAKTITYTMKHWSNELTTDSLPGRSVFYVGNTYDVKARRPNQISVSVSPGVEREVTVQGVTHKEFLFDPGTIYINNGKQSITSMPKTHTYRTGGGMEALNRDNGGYSHYAKADWIFDEKPLEGYRLLPESRDTSSTVIVYLLTDPNRPLAEEKVYFDRKTGYLTKVSVFGKDAQGTWKENWRYEFNYWDFNVRLPADTFNVRPPRNYLTTEEFKKLHNIH